MAKGQQKSGREAKKPKAEKKVTIAAAPSRKDLPTKTLGKKEAD